MPAAAAASDGSSREWRQVGLGLLDLLAGLLLGSRCPGRLRESHTQTSDCTNTSHITHNTVPVTAAVRRDSECEQTNPAAGTGAGCQATRRGSSCHPIGEAPLPTLSGPGQASLTLELPAAGGTGPACHSLHARTNSSNFRLWPRCPTSVALTLLPPTAANKHGHDPFLNLSCFQNPVLLQLPTPS